LGRHKRLQAYGLDHRNVVRDITKCVEPEYSSAAISDFTPELQDVFSEWTGNERLFFCGDTGTGKTRAMYALFKAAPYNGFDCRLFDFGQLCRKIRSSFNTNIPEQKLRDEFLNLDVLFIDDMGLKPSTTDFEYDIFYDILDKRINYKLATVISSNKAMDELGKIFDKRISSRLSVFREVRFSGQDRRTKEGNPK